MKKIVHVLYFLLLAFFVQGQDLSTYTPLKFEGEIPQDFLVSSSQKYEKDLEKISEKAKSSSKKDQEQFYLESNFHIDDLLKSGRVLFNDPISEYTASVAKEILKDEPEVFKKLRFYTIRSSAVNAFATDQGIIFVTMGLLAQLENEAQLAFVLSHEITHIKEKHAIELYEEINQLPSNEKNSESFYAETGFKEEAFARSYFSKEKEMEADKEGLSQYLKTDYDLDAVLQFFDVLQYSYLPFDEIKFKKSFFETPYLTFPDSFFLDKVNIVKGIDDFEDDSESTHPNIGKRRIALRADLQSLSNDNRKEFIVSKEEFEKVRDIARFELPLFHLQSEQFELGIYSAYLSLQKYPDNKYLQKCVAQGLYSLLKYRNYDTNKNKSKWVYKDDEEEKLDIDEIEGELQGIYYFFNQISIEDLNLLGIQYLWNLYLKYPEDDYLKQVAEDALIELVYYHNKTITNFQPAPPSDIEPSVEKNDSTNLSKYDKIKLQRKAVKQSNRVFTDLLKEEKFTAFFEEAVAISERKTKRFKYNESDEGNWESIKRRERWKKKGRRMGIEKILVFNPYYIVMDGRKSEVETRLIKSEKKQIKLNKQIETNANLVGLHTENLDASNLKATDTEKWNEILLLNDWIGEQGNFSSLSITPGYRQEEINKIIEKYGTKYLMLPGVISIQTKRNIAGTILGAFVAYPAIPAFVYNNLNAPYTSLLYVMVYNLETGQADLVKYEYMSVKHEESVFNLHLYDALLQINSKSKNKK